MGPQSAPIQILNPLQHRLDLSEWFGLISLSPKESLNFNGVPADCPLPSVDSRSKGLMAHVGLARSHGVLWWLVEFNDFIPKENLGLEEGSKSVMWPSWQVKLTESRSDIPLPKHVAFSGLIGTGLFSVFGTVLQPQHEMWGELWRDSCQIWVLTRALPLADWVNLEGVQLHGWP